MTNRAGSRAARSSDGGWNFNLVVGGLVVVFILGLILRLAQPVLFPFFVALFLAFIVSPILDFLTRVKVPRAAAVVLIVLVTFLILYLLGFFFYSSGKSFASEIPKYEKKFQDLTQYLRQTFHITSLEWDPLGWLTDLDTNRIASFLLKSLGPFFSFLTNLLLVFLFLVFILAGHGSLQAKVQGAYNREQARQIQDIVGHITRQVQRYLVIKTAVNLVAGLLTTAFLMVLGLDFALIFGLLAFILSYIPHLGAVFAATTPALLAFVQFDSFALAFLVLLVLYLMHQALGLLEVKVQGEGLGLSPLLVFFSLIFWGWLWGIPGMVLAVPILAIIKIICFNIPAFKPLSLMMGSRAEKISRSRRERPGLEFPPPGGAVR